MSIRDWPEEERPQERLLSEGSERLSDAELLALFLRSGQPGQSAVSLARLALRHFGNIRRLLSADCTAFCQVKGLGVVRYTQLQAALELSRRHLAISLQESDALNASHKVKGYLKARLRDLRHEVFAALLLDTQHRILSFEQLSVGTIDQATVYPREVARLMLERHAAAVIFAHNHPSGRADPSDADIRLTRKLQNALALLDIRVLDHFIVADQHIMSFAEQGLLS